MNEWEGISLNLDIALCYGLLDEHIIRIVPRPIELSSIY